MGRGGGVNKSIRGHVLNYTETMQKAFFTREETQHTSDD